MAKILIIDDEETIVTYLTLVLEDAGYQTCSADNGDSGLRLAREERPDLITLDIMMPKRSGLSVYAEMKSDPDLSQIPVIIVSGFTALCDLRDPEAFSKIVRDETVPRPECCMEKPIDIPEFLRIVDALSADSSTRTEESVQ